MAQTRGMDDVDVCWSSGGEEEAAEPDLVVDPEEWMDYHSEFLLTLWHQLQDQVAAMGVPILDRCGIGQFTEFCFKHSSGHKPPC